MVVYEINRQVFPTAPSPTTTHLLREKQEASVSDLVHLMLVLVPWDMFISFFFLSMLNAYFSTREMMLISTSTKKLRGGCEDLLDSSNNHVELQLWSLFAF